MNELQRNQRAALEVAGGFSEPDEWVAQERMEALLKVTPHWFRARNEETGVVVLAAQADGATRTWAYRMGKEST